MKMDYRRDLQHNYLVVETGEKTENYITRMMTENQVQGLLGCECRRMDQKKLYYYDITSKISLAEKSRLKKVKGSEVLLIIQGLLNRDALPTPNPRYSFRVQYPRLCRHSFPFWA